MTRQNNKSQRSPDKLRPWLLAGMTALCVARPLFPSESAANYGDGLPMVMLWIALAVFWLLGAIGSPHTPCAESAHGVCRLHSIRFGCTDAAVLALVGWQAVAALWAVGHGAPRPAINMLWEWVGMGLCYFMARQLIDTARKARAVAAVMVALAVALSGYGLYQCAYEMPHARASYAADPEAAMREAGLWFPPGSPERKLFEDRLQDTKVTASFALTNSLAAVLAPWLVVLAGIVAASVRGDSSRRTVARHAKIGDRSRLPQKRWLLGMAFCAIPITICLLMTKSRSGYIATGLGLAMVWLLSRRRKIRVGWKVPALIVATAVVVIAAAVALGRINSSGLYQASKSFGYRIQYWQSSWGMIVDHPIVGCGPGNFQNVYTQYKLPEASEEVSDPHNFLLEIWATAGTPAMLAFLAVLGCFAGRVGWSGQWAVGSGQWAEDSPPPSSNPQSLIPNPSPADAWLHILAGGACGFLLSIPIGQLSAAPPSVAAVLLGLPLAGAAVALLFGWIRDGRLPRLLPAVGVVVLLVDLMASGGIGLPSVAGTLWLLLSLGLQGQQPRVFRVWGAWLGLLAVMALALACYHTAYGPVLGCQAQMRMAEREPALAIEHLEAAAAADPWAAEPWRQLAAVEFENWWRQPSLDVFQRFERANARALELAPNSAPAWLAAGDAYLRAASKTDGSGGLIAGDVVAKAVAACHRAVELYPNSAAYRAKLAEACRAAGDGPAFRRQAEAALRLDKVTPHLDKKLPADVRNRLIQGLQDAR